MPIYWQAKQMALGMFRQTTHVGQEGICRYISMSSFPRMDGLPWQHLCSEDDASFWIPRDLEFVRDIM